MSMTWIPTVEVETNSGIRAIPLQTKLLMDRKIFINGQINEEMANNFFRQMTYLQERQEPIEIYINSGGGEVTAGLMMYDIIQNATVPLNLYCTGMAASMAAVLFAGGEKGHRFILPHSKTMIHEPLISNGVGGSASSIRNISDSIQETRRTLNELLAKHTGKMIEEIDEATSFDNYMNAEESIAFGMCDAVWEGDGR